MICAVLRFLGTLRSVIMTIIKSPMRRAENPSFIVRSEELIKRITLNRIRIVPKILARI